MMRRDLGQVYQRLMISGNGYVAHGIQVFFMLPFAGKGGVSWGHLFMLLKNISLS